MDKVINYLESRKIFLNSIDDSMLSGNQQNIKRCELKLLHESLSQLQAHKTKIDELKEWATTNYNHFDKIVDDAAATVKTDFEEGAKIICKDILQKLEELEG